MGRSKRLLPVNDRSGKQYGKWLLLRVIDVKRYVCKSGKKTVVWYYSCACECGAVYRVGWPDIRSGKSCQCRECSLKEHLINSQEGILRFGKKNSNYRGSEDIPGRWLSRAKNNADTRGLDFKITISDLQNQWVKQKGLCFYTGIPLKFSQERHAQDTNIDISVTASLDRVDSTKGYAADNIAWTSKTVNKVKMNLPHFMFVKMCEMVYKYSEAKQL